jgi:hypothetical protein
MNLEESLVSRILHLSTILRMNYVSFYDPVRAADRTHT